MAERLHFTSLLSLYRTKSLFVGNTLKCLGKIVHQVGKLLSVGSGRNFLHCICILVQAAITRYHRLGSLISRNPCLTVLEAGSPGPGCQYCQVLGEGLLSSWQVTVSSFHREQKEETSPHISSYKGTNPIHEGYTLTT